jgi:hypothetical protein
MSGVAIKNCREKIPDEASIINAIFWPYLKDYICFEHTRKRKQI